ncbi:hypothetical protein K432DRAFT_426214 [Lepidopterella palustris CBS 459.81]|uniref:Uncharacterized protein n=1 Tax=Lepidopterella palustris CBS 459.81 TaxID=1314670 RepID=A0A8E2EA57_9PEZI|nr:hypothetical protein K432DRAFT_426214 [Lepidopterella palustris CBS 459.81]
MGSGGIRNRRLLAICLSSLICVVYRLYFWESTPLPSTSPSGAKLHGFQQYGASWTSAAGTQTSAASQSPTLGVFPKPAFRPGFVQPAGYNYTRTLVVARTAEEDVDWVESELRSISFLETAIYTVDAPTAPFIVPENKGHEVMPYLTYIIDHYHNLSDITMFMHAHSATWHNDDLLGSQSSNMVHALSPPKVVRDGYFNMRCHHEPGCPDHIHPLEEDDALNKPEVTIFAPAWRELFPGVPVPKVLSQPCCAQFAVSRDRIHALPVEQYEFFRNWMLKTPLEDKLSGRVWEYVWQYIWTGLAEFCPKEHICYCDGYGVCFGGEDKYREFFDLRKKKSNWEKQVSDILGKENWVEGMAKTDPQDDAIVSQARRQIDQLDSEMKTLKEQAFERGKDPQSRALEGGRDWKMGDGF